MGASSPYDKGYEEHEVNERHPEPSLAHGVRYVGQPPTPVGDETQDEHADILGKFSEILIQGGNHRPNGNQMRITKVISARPTIDRSSAPVVG
jgi:hypothetical protein